MTTKPDEIDELISKYRADCFLAKDAELSDKALSLMAYSTVNLKDAIKKLIRTQQLELIKKIESEIIGKDNGAPFDDKYGLMYVGVLNQLRAEQRAKLNKIKEGL